MLGKQLAGIRFTSAQTSKTNTRHTEFSRIPCDEVTQHCTASSPGTQFQDTLRPEPPSLYDGSSPQHSKQQEVKFTRGPVHVSPCSTQRTQHNVRSSSCSKCATHNPASVFSLQSQITMSRRHSPNCDETKRPTATMHQTRTNELVHTFPTSTPSVPSGRFRLFLAQQSRRSTHSTNARSHNPRADNWLRNQLTYLGLVPRAYVAALVVLPVAASKGSSFARTDAHSRLQLALWVGHRTASRCLRLQGRLRCAECAGALVRR